MGDYFKTSLNKQKKGSLRLLVFNLKLVSQTLQFGFLLIHTKPPLGICVDTFFSFYSHIDL